MHPTLLGLIVVPVAILFVARNFAPRHTATVTAISFGIVAAPFFFEAMMWILPRDAPESLLGAVAFLMMLHTSPGAWLLEAAGRDSPVLAGAGYYYGALLNALVWGSVYGAAGRALDRYRMSVKTLAPNNAMEQPRAGGF